MDSWNRMLNHTY